MNVFAIVSVLTIAIFGQMANCWDQGLRDHILDVHNEMRRRPRGCEINKLEYDMTLERQAEWWAKRCSYGHEIKQGRGENLAYNTFKFDDKVNINSMMDRWYDEIKLYTYGQRSCGSNTCHYTQLVWGKTQKVGCYMHKCGYLHGTGYDANDANYLVCFYTPMGNWIGEKPYKTGCRSTCAEGQTEDRGLCVGTTNSVSECTDTNSRCSGWASRGECNRNPNYMKSKCAKSCRQCTAVGECKDSNSRCAGWASRGQCKINPGYMLSKCAKSCNQC